MAALKNIKWQKSNLTCGTSIGGRSGQPYSNKATDVLSKKVFNKQVRIDILDIDRYKRMVSIILLGDRNINLEMVKEGYAEAYCEYLKEPYVAMFIAAENKAKVEKRGIWGLSNYERPSTFRKRLKVNGP